MDRTVDFALGLLIIVFGIWLVFSGQIWHIVRGF